MPILREGELDIISHSPEQTQRYGIRLGKLLQAGDIICLSGDMGAGKTVFSSGIGQGWGTRNKVTSPTYNLVHQHNRAQDKLTLYHLDCYRMQSIDEIDTIGFDDMVESKGVIIIEWAERIEDALPNNHLWVELGVVEELRRNFILEAKGKRYQDLVLAFRNAIFGI
ncbi:MAG: tRNA (adenosine(37)-N6)-threonylcarbamoyltransferase complex ATPase subunit type 1 TsaE [Phototrophicaceae bacterium]